MGELPVIRIRELVFRWPGATAACLDIPAFEAPRGEHLFLYGPSGSGKSTLLGLLGGVLLPEHGALALLGTELSGLAAPARDRFRADHVGYIFQQFNLIPYLGVVDNVLLAVRFSSRRRERVMARGATPFDEACRLLDRLGMTGDLLHREAVRLSVGQQQRVAAARALIGGPEIIIADEPTSAMDAGLQSVFVDLLLTEAAAAGATVIFVSHDHRLAAGFPRQLALADINRAIAVGEAA
ncbi:MAG: ATP-binding cassette domain-containing protein [Betaproteobacteria bacterium]|nr:ATP-binding cassette domain-containing protein [Betaproteobacteria bacterium]